MPDLGLIPAFFLVFLRAIAFMVSGPLFAFKGIPALIKTGFSLILAIVLFPVVEVKGPLPGDVWGYGLAVVSEAGVGLLLGTAVTMILNGVRMAGQFIDFQIGYAMSSMLDPLSGAQNTLLSQFLYLLALVFFLLIDGHYVLLAGLAKSYELVPLSMASFGGGTAFTLIKVFAEAFTIALRISAPVLAVLVISDLTLGFLARTTPQINVFLTGFPIKIAVGLLTLSFLLPLLGTVFRSLYNMIERDLFILMKALV